MRKVAALCLALCACAPSPAMDAATAKSIVEKAGRGASDLDLCTVEGRKVYRVAVRRHAAARAADGVMWPDLHGAAEQGRADPVELSVLSALMLGWVEPSDFASARGNVGDMRLLALAGRLQASPVRKAVDVACPEVLHMQRVVAAQLFELQTLETQVERAKARGDDDRLVALMERADRRHRIMQAEIARLAAEIEAKVAAAS